MTSSRANRPGRDTREIRLLMSLCQITTIEEAEEFSEEFYPGDGLTSRATSMVAAIFADGPTVRLSRWVRSHLKPGGRAGGPAVATEWQQSSRNSRDHSCSKMIKCPKILLIP